VPRILTVDDSVAMRQMTAATLMGAGYEVVQAADGREALQIATDQAVDLVLTDVNMPNMDGIALVRALRAMTNYRSKPLLFLTTESTAARKLEGREAGATGWMLKPFNSERLLATIARTLK
jgi:two-component system chemotaxis response regulator CheY